MKNFEKDIELLKEVKKAEPSPYLLTKIYTRIEELEEKSISIIKLIPIGIGFILLLGVNFYAINIENNNSQNKVSESNISIYESNQLYYD